MLNAPTTALRDAIMLALALSAFSTGHVLAQTPGEDAQTETRTLDAITVTGSRISVPGVEASSPVANVERTEFMATQPVAVESFLKQFPALTPSTGPGIGYEPGGGATINMRGMGDNRTLVLIDGRRPVPFNLQSVVDTNIIPLSLLQSVEMLTGGASVVYGADAVAGVTNFILRRDFEGVELNMNWGKSVSYGDANRETYEATFGALSDDGRANAVISVGFSKADPVSHGDRPWSLETLDSTNAMPSGVETTVPAVINVIGSTGGLRQLDANGTLVPVYQRYNYIPLYLSQTGLERWQTTGLARYEFNRHAEAYAQISYTRSNVAAAQAPAGVFFHVLNVPLNNPYIPDNMRQQICTELNIGADECTSGLDGNGELRYAPLQIGRRITEMGARQNNYDAKNFQTTLDLRGDVNDHWRYDGYWSYGESEQLQSVVNWSALSKVRQAINAISVNECLDPSGGCVPLNLFGPEGSISADQYDFIQLSAFAIQSVEQTNAAFNVDGDLGNVKSPWADYPIGISAGVEYRRMVAGISPDAAYQAPGEIMGLSSSVFNFRGGFNIREAYLESILPLVSGRTGAENLSLELGYRHSEFSNTSGFDDNYGSWKYGLSWTPVETMKLRLMRQRATRAPNVGELFTPARTGVQPVNDDPCGMLGAVEGANVNTPGTLAYLCNQTGVPAAIIADLPLSATRETNLVLGGNPQLRPEKADTTTVGLVWTPTDRLSVTLDWWDIEVNEAISTPVAQDVVYGCYDAALNPGLQFNEFCALIARNPLTGNFRGAEARGITLPLSNSGFIQKTGIDLGVRLAHDLPGRFGRMQYALDVSKVTRDDFQATPASSWRDCLGYFGVSCVPSHDLRSNLHAIWTVQDISMSLVWRYFGALNLDPVQEAREGPFVFNHIAAYSYFDLGVSWQSPWHTEINLSVNNLFDKKPPVVGGSVGNAQAGSGNTFPQWYDVIGRFVTLGVSFRF